MRKILGLVLAAATPAFAQFGGGVFTCPTCASETTSAAQLAKEASLALQTAQMANMMIQEGKALIQHPNVNMSADIGLASSIAAQAKGISGTASQMNAAFQGAYAPYAPGNAATYSSALNNWAITTLRTLNGSINAAGYQGQMLQNEQAWITQLQSLTGTALGRDASLQLSNSIGNAEIGQMQALRQMTAAGNTAAATYMAGQVAAQQAQQNAQAAAFTPLGWSADGRKW